MFEPRSTFFGQVFEALDITFRRDGRIRIDNTAPLRVGRRSLQLYFNEANSRRGAYFAAHEGLYGGYDWSKYWLVARIGKKELGYLKPVPYPGQEQIALMDLIAYANATIRPGD
jgi:hypothetical protein